jgi:hypothetical protein
MDSLTLSDQILHQINHIYKYGGDDGLILSEEQEIPMSNPSPLSFFPKSKIKSSASTIESYNVPLHGGEKKKKRPKVKVCNQTKYPIHKHGEIPSRKCFW